MTAKRDLAHGVGDINFHMCGTSMMYVDLVLDLLSILWQIYAGISKYEFESLAAS